VNQNGNVAEAPRIAASLARARVRAQANQLGQRKIHKHSTDTAAASVLK